MNFPQGETTAQVLGAWLVATTANVSPVCEGTGNLSVHVYTHKHRSVCVCTWVFV